ncbi:hypothetical protein DFS28_10213 [Pseudomonas sp. 478]|nr:hypothetical protein DFS28_10213 [Pseudomonas sp. 478]TCV55940.1 hypothetical protein EDB99_10213 [Pseudomonas sp. 460]
MDATSHPFSLFSLLAAALILSGCQATNPPPTQITTPEVLPGLEVFNSVMFETPEPNSIVHAQMAYSSKAGMSLFAVKPRGRSEESWQLPAEQKSQYLQSAQLKQVCAQTTPPQWRVFLAPEHQDWQMIDRSSSMSVSWFKWPVANRSRWSNTNNLKGVSSRPSKHRPPSLPPRC